MDKIKEYLGEFYYNQMLREVENPDWINLTWVTWEYYVPEYLHEQWEGLSIEAKSAIWLLASRLSDVTAEAKEREF